jgi:hypothetical protein
MDGVNDVGATDGVAETTGGWYRDGILGSEPEAEAAGLAGVTGPVPPGLFAPPAPAMPRPVVAGFGWYNAGALGSEGE